MPSNLGKLILRMVTGLLLAGHGSQKLFGWFGGQGMEGTVGMVESFGLRPARRWAFLAGLSEFGGGILTSLGFLHPIGPIVLMAPMSMAIAKVHWNKPIWVAEGGGELPLTNIAVATMLMLSGPGRFSLDRLLGIRLGWPITALVAVTTAAGIILGIATRPTTTEQMEEETATAELQVGA
ncbi:MAG: DoxX family protein [Chloroflexota bacterium]